MNLTCRWKYNDILGNLTQVLSSSRNSVLSFTKQKDINNNQSKNSSMPDIRLKNWRKSVEDFISSNKLDLRWR